MCVLQGSCSSHLEPRSPTHKQCPFMSISSGLRELIRFQSFCLQPAPGSVPSPEQQQMLCSQLERIHTLFRRQLGIPLLGESLCAWGAGMEKLYYGKVGIHCDYSFSRATQIAAGVFGCSWISRVCLSLGPPEWCTFPVCSFMCFHGVWFEVIQAV